MNSKYDRLIKELEARKCEECGGGGQCNDAEPGDIGFNVWECPKCKGTGIVPRAALIAVSEISRGLSEVRYHNGVELGQIYQEIDGFYVFDFGKMDRRGFWSAHVFRAIADHLDDMNAPWQQTIDNDPSLSQQQEERQE